jgi:hypothetical protein
MRARPALVLASLLVGGALGCAPARSEYMQPLTAPPALAPAADAARVVFFRHGGAGAIIFTVMDEQAHFVGDAAAGTRFTVTVPPGDHVFIAWNDREPTTGASAFGLIGAAISAASGELPHVEPLRASLAAGKVYLVEVGSGGTLQPLHAPPDDGALADTMPFAPDAERGRKFFAQDTDRIEGIRKKAMDQLKGYAKDDAAGHTLRADDGR